MPAPQAARDDNIRARRGQTLCNLQPDAALRAGHKGGLALQTEPVHCKISHIYRFLPSYSVVNE